MGTAHRLATSGLASLAAFTGLILAPSSAVHADIPAPSGDNWYVVTMSAGPGGAVVSAELTASGKRLGQKPDLVGWGVAVRGLFHHVFVQYWSDGETSISTTRGARSEHVVLTAQSDGSLFMTSRWFAKLQPNETNTLLMFFTDAAFGSPTFHYSVGSGAAAVTFWHRGGSEAVVVGDTADAGIALQAAGYGGGALTHTANTTAGIVGGIAAFPSQAATGAWRSPDGRHGTFYMTPNVQSGDLEFAGPPGKWIWNWAGVSAGSVSFAAYAPVGDAWRSFA